MANKSKAILSLFVTVVVLVVAVQVLRGHFAEKREAEARAFAEIEATFRTPVIPSDADVDESELVPDSVAESFGTRAERLSAAVAQADSFLEKHPDSSLVPAAQLLKARFLLDQGAAADALALFETVSGTSGVPASLKLMALDGVAFAHEATGAVADALSAFSALADEAAQNNGLLQDRALFNKARLLAQTGDTAAAAETFREVVEKFPRSSLRDDINNRLADLESADAAGEASP